MLHKFKQIGSVSHPRFHAYIGLPSHLALEFHKLEVSFQMIQNFFTSSKMNLIQSYEIGQSDSGDVTELFGLKYIVFQATI